VTDNTNIIDAKKQFSGDGGDRGGDVYVRLARLEERMDGIKENMATKVDISNIKIWALTGAIIGLVTAASIAIAILKLFP
jgi:hypothetical protein